MRLIIRVSLILSFASRGATSTAFAICLTKRHIGVRSKETAGRAAAGGRLPSGAGGAASPAFSARSAVLSARNTKPIRDIVSVKLRRAAVTTMSCANAGPSACSSLTWASATVRLPTSTPETVTPARMRGSSAGT